MDLLEVRWKENSHLSEKKCLRNNQKRLLVHHCRQKTGIQDTLMAARKIKWRWVGHVTRMEVDRWALLTTAWTPYDWIYKCKRSDGEMKFYVSHEWHGNRWYRTDWHRRSWQTPLLSPVKFNSVVIVLEWWCCEVYTSSSIPYHGEFKDSCLQAFSLREAFAQHLGYYRHQKN